MNNQELAKLFSEMADLLIIQGANRFKVRAIERAAQIIEGHAEPMEAVMKRGVLETIDGIGKGIAEKIVEAFETGAVAEHQELCSEFPEGLLELLRVPNLGPKKVKLFYDELQIASVEQLKAAAETGKLQDLPGMGKKSEEKILKGLATMQQSTGRFPLGKAYPIATEIYERLSALKGVKRSAMAGSLRRGKETVGDLDILVSAKDATPVMEEFLKTSRIRDVLVQGKTKTSIQLDNNLQIDLRVVPEESFGAALQYFTGSKEHNVKLRELAVKQGLKVNEYGVFKEGSDQSIAGKTEEEVYKAIGLAWVPPELREGFDEIDLAKKNQLPTLIEQGDIISALHNHTTASDGKLELEELVSQAKARGYKIIAVTDHSMSLGIANGLSPDRLKRRIDEIAELNEKIKGIRVLTGSEVEIKADGSIDYDEDLLEQLDVVVGSVHVAQDQPKDKLNQRVCRAIANPHVDILGHPSGRLIGQRPPMELDWEKVFEAAAEHQTALEINAHYLRLDLKDQHIREASQHGVVFTINTDTHVLEHFDNLPFGVQTARRGRLSADDVINTWTWARLSKWLKGRYE